MSYNREDIDKFVRDCDKQYERDISRYYIYRDNSDYMTCCALRYKACMRVADTMVTSLPTMDG